MNKLNKILISIIIITSFKINSVLAVTIKNFIIAAGFSNNQEVVKQFVKEGRNINAQGAYRRTALICAANSNNKEIVTFLLANGANVNIKDKEGNSALDFATQIEKLDIAKALLERPEINVNSQARLKHTALYGAIYFKNYELIKLLLIRGAQVNIRDVFGETPFAMAQRKGDIEAVALLFPYYTLKARSIDYVKKNKDKIDPKMLKHLPEELSELVVN